MLADHRADPIFTKFLHMRFRSQTHTSPLKNKPWKEVTWPFCHFAFARINVGDVSVNERVSQAIDVNSCDTRRASESSQHVCWNDGSEEYEKPNPPPKDERDNGKNTHLKIYTNLSTYPKKMLIDHCHVSLLEVSIFEAQKEIKEVKCISSASGTWGFSFGSPTQHESLMVATVTETGSTTSTTVSFK